ncbi:hypothetical protein B0H17DRAFT_1217386 [Mycena rosella]|uniref:EF-hand domain-containing protein n=1 Tax=Mycena rosella TaxID=1033263 RepID=A0AAD7FRD2_MYCRO|nr:hypothetical protein B0H17DRAFT_1217386 [Mycena rosella]
MDAKIDHADAAMQNAGKLIQQVANSTSKKQNKPTIRKILTALQQTMGVLGGAAEIDPRAKTAVTLFMSVLQLEIDRRENDEEIVAVCYSMTSMVFVLHHLNSHVDRAEDLMDQLAEQMSNMSNTIKEFGAFADVYYTKCKSFLVRFSRASEFKGKIRGFVSQFQEYQSNIEFVLVVQMAGNQGRMAADVRAIKDSISTLINHVGAPSGENEKKAWEYIKRHGVEILETEEGQTNIGKILQQSITSNTIQASSEMDSGPHDLIDEPDVKEIWKGNGWKFSVKSRTFVDALCNYYTSKFAGKPAEEDEDDSWTLKVLGKVINYPALGEAIDEDSSGFISVHEMNHFLKKNKDDLKISTPTWFAFWAVGPRYLNDSYTDQISEIMNDLEDLCRKLKSDADHDDLDLCIDGYLETITVIKFITEWSEFDDDVLDDMGFEREDLVRVADRLAARDRAIIADALNGIDYKLTAAAMLPPVTQQSGFRIEQSIMVLLCLILRKHHQTISDGMQNMTRQVFASEWQAMDDTLWVLVEEFHDRLKDLCRSWRSQKQDVELQISCYAGGLFNGWYQEASFARCAKDQDNDDEEDDADADGSSAPLSLDAKVDQLSQRVSALDTRLETIERLLKQIGGVPSSAQTEVEDSVRGHSATRATESQEQTTSHEAPQMGDESYNDEREVGQDEDSDTGKEQYNNGYDGNERENEGEQGDDPEEPEDY